MALQIVKWGPQLYIVRIYVPPLRKSSAAPREPLCHYRHVYLTSVDLLQLSLYMYYTRMHRNSFWISKNPLFEPKYLFITLVSESSTDVQVTSEGHGGVSSFEMRLRLMSTVTKVPTTLCKLPRGTLDELDVCSEVGRFTNTLNGSEDNPGYEVGGKALATDAVEPNDIAPRQKTFYRSMYKGTADLDFQRYFGCHLSWLTHM
uniref:Uncharacterized protein n=1 Tax=Glossina morsitans morsitans TaxID=37546 RepID=A0A1B0FKD4_GLOMM